MLGLWIGFELMALNIDEKVVSTERHEFRIEIYGDRGVCWTDVYKAVAMATQQLRALGLVGEGRDPSDDAIRISSDDEHVVVSYTLEKYGDSSRIV